MTTEQTHTEPNWKRLPGTILDGGYEMEELLEADNRRARFRIRVLGDRTIEAFASFFPVVGTAAQEQIEAWELLRRIPHPNLSRPLAAGQRQLDGAEVVYLVSRKADETLSGVIAERALTPEEATEVLLSGARALEHLARHGLVHGSISPEQVLAVGDSIQLSAEGVQRLEGQASLAPRKVTYAAPESTNGNVTTTAAVWSLGATIFETLTQKRCGEDCREQAKEVPLAWVLDRCLDSEPDKRCKPEEIPALVKSGPPPVLAAPAAEEVHQPTVAPSVVSVPAEEVRPEQVHADQVKVMSVASGAAGAASALAAGVSLPTDVPAKPVMPDVSAPRPPATSSVSQARTKVFQQAEFDALTAPQSTSSGTAKASVSAAIGASLGSPALSASPSGAAAARPSLVGSRIDRSPIDRSPIDSSPAARPALFNSVPGEIGRRRERGTFEAEPEQQRSRFWMVIAAAAAALLLLFWAMRSKPVRPTSQASSGPATTAQSAPAPVSSENSATAGKAWPTRTLEPDKPASGVSPAKKSGEAARPSPAPKAELAAASGPVWRVIVYAFSREEDAQKKVRALNARHSHLEAQLFLPNGQSSPYLVTVGGRMTREDAARFRSKALRSGMPRDSYIQNYKP